MASLIRIDETYSNETEQQRQAQLDRNLHEADTASNSNDDFDVSTYMHRESTKDLLRFSTAGSVDDGKSTLIGRLLYDTQNVYDDQIRSIEGKGTTAPGVLDLALLTDGLRAEREQGITIDVAYRYFSTAHRKFIIADTPGHEEYTRNMATGASTASASIVLVDARKGMLPQSRRHASINALLGVRHIIVAINKMDLVDYAEATFAQIRDEFMRFFRAQDIPGVHDTTLYFVPVSALLGDNVVRASAATPWYGGDPLLTLLEKIPAAAAQAATPFRLAVQRVVRPSLDFRGFAGQIASGTVRVGDRLVALPSGRMSQVRRIVTYDGDLAEATAPLAVTLTLDDEIDISRGDLLADAGRPASVCTAFKASLVWMDATPLDRSRRYLLKHMSRTVAARVDRILTEPNAAAMAKQGESTLALNEIAVVQMTSLLPLAVDLYTLNRTTGSFVLIDPLSNATVAAGMIRELTGAQERKTATGAVTDAERIARFGHAGAVLRMHGPAAFAALLERTLFEHGANVLLASLDEPQQATLVAAGLFLLDRVRLPSSSFAVSCSLEDGDLVLDLSSYANDLPSAVLRTITFLRTNGILMQETFL